MKLLHSGKIILYISSDRIIFIMWARQLLNRIRTLKLKGTVCTLLAYLLLSCSLVVTWWFSEKF
jgi:hypothetical protein